MFNNEFDKKDNILLDLFNIECIIKPLVLSVILLVHVMNKGSIFVESRNYMIVIVFEL